MAQARNLLHLIDLFAHLDVDDLNAIGDQCKWQRVSRGSEILPQRDNSTDVFFVVEGRVAAKGYSQEGKEVTYTEIGRGEYFGEFSAIDGEPRSASIETVEEAYVGQLSSAKFRQLFIDYPSVGLKFAEHMVAKNRYLTARIFEFSTLAVRERICAELVRMCEEFIQRNPKIDAPPYHIHPAPSHYQIATRLSTHREAVTRELSDLASRGILEVARQRISILDLPRLRELSRPGT